MPSPRMTFEGLLEAVPDALVGVDKSGKIRVVNHQAESMFGYQRDKLIGAPVEMLVPESLRKLHVAHRERYVTAPTARPIGTDLKLIGRRADGTEFPVDISLSVSDPGDGMLVIAAVRDMTAREKTNKERELLLRESAVVEFSGEAMISITVDGIITSWNPAAERLYGYSGEEIVGRSIMLLSPKSLAPQGRDAVTVFKVGDPVGSSVAKRVRKDGTEFWASITVSPIRDRHGRVIGAATTAHDVTEQRKASELAQRLAAIVDASNDAVISFTLEGVITSWNPAAERLYGYSADEIVGRPGWFLTPEDRLGETRAALEKILAGEYVEHLDTARIRKDGTVFPVSLTMSPIPDADGAAVGAVSIARDVTAQREALAAAQRLAAIVEHSDNAIISKTLDGIITSWNPASERLFGYSGDEIVGQSIEVLTPEDRRGEIQAILAKIGAGEHVQNFETMRARKNGQAFPASLTVSPIRDSDGSVIGASTIAQDLTKQKEASELARSMIEASLDPLVTISLGGKITDVNEATVKATGVPRDKLIGTSFPSYFTDPKKAEKIYQRVFEQGSVTDYPLTLRHQDGQERYTDVLYNASLYRDTSGNVLGVFASARDVTKQVQAQKEIAHQQAMELDRLAQLERFQRLTVGRELKMIELKKEIEYLRKNGPTDGSEHDDQH